MSVTIVRRGIEQTDLRALADDVLVETVDGFIPEGDFAARLAQGYRSLLSSLEAREVEHRMLKRSNTVLNERLEAVEQRAERAEAALGEATEFYERAVDLLRDMPKEANDAEAAKDWVKRRHDYLVEWGIREIITRIARISEGREEKPS